MRKPNLTRTSSWVNGKLCHAYEFDDEEYQVFDSAQNMLLVIELFHDEDLSARNKQSLLLTMLFPDPAETFERVGKERTEHFLNQILWESCGLDLSGERIQGNSKLFDWEEDASRIQASFLKAYGLPWEKASRELSFIEICALLGALLEDESTTPFQQAIYYRTATPPKFGKGNDEAREAWHSAKRHFALSSSGDAQTNEIEAANNATRDLFAALKAAAQAGGEI